MRRACCSAQNLTGDAAFFQLIPFFNCTVVSWSLSPCEQPNPHVCSSLYCKVPVQIPVKGTITNIWRVIKHKRWADDSKDICDDICTRTKLLSSSLRRCSLFRYPSDIHATTFYRDLYRDFKVQGWAHMCHVGKVLMQFRIQVWIV